MLKGTFDKEKGLLRSKYVHESMSKLSNTRAHTLTTAADGTWETTQPNVKEKMQIKSECLVINISIFEYFLAE